MKKGFSILDRRVRQKKNIKNSCKKYKIWSHCSLHSFPFPNVINNWIFSFLITPFQIHFYVCVCCKVSTKHIFNVENYFTICWRDFMLTCHVEGLWISDQCLLFRSKCNFQLLFVIFDHEKSTNFMIYWHSLCGRVKNVINNFFCNFLKFLNLYFFNRRES